MASGGSVDTWNVFTKYSNLVGRAIYFGLELLYIWLEKWSTN